MTDILRRLEEKYSYFAAAVEPSVEAYMKKDGWRKGERYYEDNKREYIWERYKEAIQQESRVLSEEDKCSILHHMLEEWENELEDDYCERRTAAAVANLVLIDLIKNYLKEGERWSGADEEQRRRSEKRPIQFSRLPDR